MFAIPATFSLTILAGTILFHFAESVRSSTLMCIGLMPVWVAESVDESRKAANGSAPSPVIDSDLGTRGKVEEYNLKPSIVRVQAFLPRWLQARCCRCRWRKCSLVSAKALGRPSAT
eukprot:6200565-Pleurochrysis_carterae.AAC.2